MPTLRQLRRGAATGAAEERLSLTDVVEWQAISNGGGLFPYGFGSHSLTGPFEMPANDLESYANQIYKRNGIVYACVAVRAAIFAEIRFRYANLDQGRIGRLFGDPSLDILNRPWPNGTTGELAARMIQDVDLAGNSYWVREGNRLWRRDPDKMLIVLSADESSAQYADVAGYVYYPGGIKPGAPSFTYLPGQVAHWSPNPDPTATYRGMSWLTPVLREIASDGAATDHKMQFFRQGAVPNMVVTTPAEIMTQEQFDKFVAATVKMLGVDASKVTREASFADDLEADSLDVVELVMELEEVFGVEVPEDELADVKTVGQAFDLIMAKV